MCVFFPIYIIITKKKKSFITFQCLSRTTGLQGGISFAGEPHCRDESDSAVFISLTTEALVYLFEIVIFSFFDVKAKGE